MATEVNEAHSLLAAELYDKQVLADCSGEEIIAILAAFVNEKISDDTIVTINDLNVPESIRNKLYKVGQIAIDLKRIESGFNVPDSSYWDMSLSWVEPVWRWLNGETSAQLCSDYCIYDGNLLRTLSRMLNIADEWMSLATYCEHTEMVAKLVEVKEKMLQGISVSDSLYLRI